jgi:hypothetical protein
MTPPSVAERQLTDGGPPGAFELSNDAVKPPFSAAPG